MTGQGSVGARARDCAIADVGSGDGAVVSVGVGEGITSSIVVACRTTDIMYPNNIYKTVCEDMKSTSNYFYSFQSGLQL